jgi:hypothetical protein
MENSLLVQLAKRLGNHRSVQVEPINLLEARNGGKPIYLCLFGFQLSRRNLCAQIADGISDSYMASLEAKLERLEKRLAELDCQGAEAGPVEGDDPNNGSNLVGRAAVAAEKEATEVGKLTSKADQPTIAGACIVLAQNDTAHEPPLSAAAIKKIRKKQQQEDDGEIEELVADIGYMSILSLLSEIIQSDLT